MRASKQISILGIMACLLSSCSSGQESDEEKVRRLNQKGEYIYRQKGEVSYAIIPPQQQVLEPYPWVTHVPHAHARITKEHFRCKGSSLNPVRIETQKNGSIQRYNDCEGGSKHSLPLVNGNEYIYPAMLDILNHIQEKTKSSVVITCGHRCPIHNRYVDSTAKNVASKHQIGAEVDFYVQGWEEKPEAIVQIILEMYKENSRYANDPSYSEFQRYDKADSNVAIPPWYNKEIFVKLVQRHEGRNFDNRHLYPYITIQMRYDREHKEKIVFSFEKAQKGYLRW